MKIKNYLVIIKFITSEILIIKIFGKITTISTAKIKKIIAIEINRRE